MAFRFIGGKCSVATLPALVKAESVFYPLIKMTCITTTLNSERQNIQHIKWLPVVGQTAGDWLSIMEAIRYSTKKGEHHLHIETNNLQVIESLLFEKNIVKYDSYKHNVLSLANQTNWTGIRWVPPNATDVTDATVYDEIEYNTEKTIQHAFKN